MRITSIIQTMTRRIGPRSVGALGLTALACAGLAAAAFAGVVKDDTSMTGRALASQTVGIDSKVTLALDDVYCSQRRCSRRAYHGRVKSRRHACEVRRKVKVFRMPSGGLLSAELVGKARSNRRGKWNFIRGISAGRFQAEVVRSKKEGPGGRIFVCRGDRSRVIDFH